jgi:hypothetical protein
MSAKSGGPGTERPAWLIDRDLDVVAAPLDALILTVEPDLDAATTTISLLGTPEWVTRLERHWSRTGWGNWAPAGSRRPAGLAGGHDPGRAQDAERLTDGVLAGPHGQGNVADTELLDLIEGVEDGGRTGSASRDSRPVSHSASSRDRPRARAWATRCGSTGCAWGADAESAMILS